MSHEPVIARTYQDQFIDPDERRWLNCLMNICQLKTESPEPRWISEILITKENKVKKGMNLLLSIPQSKISNALSVIIFGGSVATDQSKQIVRRKVPIADCKYIQNFRYYEAAHKKYFKYAFFDLYYITEYFIKEYPIAIIRFAHYGIKNREKSSCAKKKMRFFNFDGDIDKSFLKERDLFDDILDETRPIYSLNAVLDMMLEAIAKNGNIKIIDLHIRFKKDIILTNDLIHDENKIRVILNKNRIILKISKINKINIALS